MRSDIIEQGAVILFGEREDSIAKFYTRIKDLTKLDWSNETYSSFSAMIAQESYKKHPWCKEWNNLSAVSIAKLWILVNQDYNNSLKTTIRVAGFSDSNVQQLFLDGIGILRPRTKKLLVESELFSELELKLIEASANKIKKDSDAARAKKIAAVLEKRKNKQTTYQEQKEKASKKVKEVVVTAKQEKPVQYKAIIFTENMSTFKKIMFAVRSILNNRFEEVQRVRN
jgi:hypothetical protein|nr:MAG TPA: hypothetical protein [Caudoviricetes sp.]